MQSYIIHICNGIEVIDTTPEAYGRISAMNYLENRKKREQIQEKKRRLRNPLYKMICGIL